MKVLLVVLFALKCNSFLLEPETSTKATMTGDQRYNFLMNLLVEEKESRKKSEAAVSRELVAFKEEVVDNVTEILTVEQNQTFSLLYQIMVNSSKITEQELSGKITDVEAKQNETSVKLQEHSVKLQQYIDEVNNRVALTTCSVSVNATCCTIRFTEIQTIYGITDNSSITDYGTFTCEKSGLYIISVYILSPSGGAWFFIRNNNQALTDAFIATPKSDSTTTSLTTVTPLKPYDEIRVTGYLAVDGDFQSCMTIVQIQ